MTSYINEIPAELAFSTHSVMNNKNTGDASLNIDFRSEKIQDNQHSSGIDFTEIQCKNKIHQPCTMAPGSTWKQWNISERTALVTGDDRGRPGWHYVLLVDNEETISIYRNKITGENAGKHSLNMTQYGQILMSGWGQKPPNDV